MTVRCQWRQSQARRPDTAAGIVRFGRGRTPHAHMQDTASCISQMPKLCHWWKCTAFSIDYLCFLLFPVLLPDIGKPADFSLIDFQFLTSQVDFSAYMPTETCDTCRISRSLIAFSSPAISRSCTFHRHRHNIRGLTDVTLKSAICMRNQRSVLVHERCRFKTTSKG